MTEIDTSAEAVRQVLSALREGPNLMFDADVADFIEALAAERDRLAAELESLRKDVDALRPLSLRCLNLARENDRLAAENKRMRGQRTTQWCAEASELRAAWLRVIQAENTCAVTGSLCHAKRCGCAEEQQMLIEEARVAMAGGNDNGNP